MRKNKAGRGEGSNTGDSGVHKAMLASFLPAWNAVRHVLAYE